MENKLYKGIPVSPGQCIAEVEILNPYPMNIPDQQVQTAEIEREINRIKECVALAKLDISKLIARVEQRLNRTEASIFEAHLSILNDHMLISEMQMMVRQFHFRAESAVYHTLQQFLTIFKKMDDPYLRERALDMRDVGYRMLNKLLKREEAQVATEKLNYVLIADELLPSQFILPCMQRVRGIVVSERNQFSHSAILARSLGIPMVSGVNQTDMKKLFDAKVMLVDGTSGEIEVAEADTCPIKG
jgi:phosphotransferase system enzyme I (PtsI)